MTLPWPTADERPMRRALRLAARGRHASPNPMVGCVLIRPDETRVGEGFHPEPGQPHAEIFALRQAGEKARGTTAYVTLEPCAHFGRTPPCADALIAAGVARVVCAMADPDARVAGQGFARLRAHGVPVDVGLLEVEARTLNAAYIQQRTMGTPWVTLKTAQTLDGKIATRTGDSQWITSPISRLAVHRTLRDRCDAILTGVGTILADDPSLTTRLRHKAGRNPLRVIADSRARTPITSRVVRQAAHDGKTLIAVTEAAPSAAIAALADAGCRVLVCDADDAGRVHLPALLRALGTTDNVVRVLAEGGGTLTASLLQAGLVDRWLAFIAPKVVGGDSATGPIGGQGAALMADAVPVTLQTVTRCGPDIRIDARFG